MVLGSRTEPGQAQPGLAVITPPPFPLQPLGSLQTKDTLSFGKWQPQTWPGLGKAHLMVPV